MNGGLTVGSPQEVGRTGVANVFLAYENDGHSVLEAGVVAGRWWHRIAVSCLCCLLSVVVGVEAYRRKRIAGCLGRYAQRRAESVEVELVDASEETSLCGWG